MCTSLRCLWSLMNTFAEARNPVYWYTTMPSVYIRTVLYVSMFYHKYMYQYICWYLTNICRFLISLLGHPISLSVLISERIEVFFFFNNVECMQMYTCTCTVMLFKISYYIHFSPRILQTAKKNYLCLLIKLLSDDCWSKQR